MSERLLREYVRTLLREDDGGGDGDGGDYGGYGFGPALSQGGFEKIFVQPFTDVLKTGQKAVSDVSSKTQYLIGGALGSVVSSFVPFMAVDWKELQQKEQQRSEKIKDKYGDVINRTNASLFKGDAALMSFLYAPHAFVTTHATAKAPEVALGFLDTIAGESETVGKLTGALGGAWQKIKQGIGVEESYHRLREFKMDQRKLKKIFGSNEVKQAFAAYEKNTRRDAVKMAQLNVKAIVDRVEQLLGTESTKRLDKMSKGKFSDIMAKVGGKERKEAAAHVANTSQKVIAKFYVDKLEEEMKDLPDGLKKIYHQGIKQIHALEKR